MVREIGPIDSQEVTQTFRVSCGIRCTCANLRIANYSTTWKKNYQDEKSVLRSEKGNEDKDRDIFHIFLIDDHFLFHQENSCPVVAIKSCPANRVVNQLEMVSLLLVWYFSKI